MIHAFFRIGILFLAILVIGAPEPAAAETGPRVFVSIVPQQYMVNRIGNGWVTVEVMVPPGASPATYEPKPRQMARLTDAAVYFAIGVPFEAVWLDRIAAANDKMRIVQTDQGIQKLPMATHRHEAPHGHEAVHGHDDDADRGIPDPHIWTSPPLVMLQARAIYTALIEVDPAHRHIYTENYNRFIQELVDLDLELLALFSQKGRDNRFMVFHPSWGYFAHAYGLRQVPIELEGKAPKPAQLQQLIEAARAHGIRVIFAQPQFSTESAAVIAREIGGSVVLADPLAADWAANLRRQAAQFKAAVR